MSLTPQELRGPSVTNSGSPLRYAPYENGVLSVKVAITSGAPILQRLTPFAFNETTQQWQVWSAGISVGVSEVQSYSLGGPTAGNYKLNFDGQITANIAFNANAAAVLAALEALSNIAPGDVVVSGGPSNTTAVVVTFAATYANMNVPAILIDSTGLTGGNASTVASVTTEGDPGSGVFEIRGFLMEDDFQTSATNELLASMLIKGLVDRRDVVLPSGEVAADLEEALRDGCRERGLDIQGLTGVH